MKYKRKDNMATNDFKPMECPVCHKYYFKDDLNIDDNTSNSNKTHDIYCPHCGWKYDLIQFEYPDIGYLTNDLSLNNYKKWFKKKIAKNPNYDFTLENRTTGPHRCPVCNKYTFSKRSSFEICPYCGWEDDDIMEDSPDESGGANDLCLNDCRKEYQRLINENPNYKWKIAVRSSKK